MNAERAIEYFEDAVRETDEIIADCSADLQAELTEQKEHFVVALTALREKREREKGCVWCKEDNKVFHDGQHYHMFCSYCGKRLKDDVGK